MQSVRFFQTTAELWIERSVAYKIHRKDCSDIYTGSSQYLHKKVRNDVQPIRNDNSEASALAKHAVGEAHCFNFENPK